MRALPGTRRELLHRGIKAGAVAAGGAGVLAALAPAAHAAPGGQDEARTLGQALEIEQLVVLAYRRALGSGILRSPVKGQLRTHLEQELEHVATLQRAATERGVSIPAAPTLSSAQAELSQHGIHWSLTHIHSQHDYLKLLVDVESLAENAYFQAVETVQDLSLAGTCAEIMGCEAQHWSVLSGLLNHRDPKKAVPYPFVEGSP